MDANLPELLNLSYASRVEVSLFLLSFAPARVSISAAHSIISIGTRTGEVKAIVDQLPETTGTPFSPVVDKGAATASTMSTDASYK